MQYSFSPKLKLASFVLIILGAVLYGIGVFMNSADQKDPKYIENMVQSHPEKFFGDYQSAEYQELNQTHLEGHDNPQWHTWEHHVANRPWAALMTASYFAFGLSAAALFFLCVQFASNSGWSIVVSRVMEGIASYIPVGGILMLIIVFASAFGGNHLFHWMDKSLVDPTDPHYDIFIASKSKIWLNIPGWLSRSVLYVLIFSAGLFWIKRATKRLDEVKDRKNWEKLFTAAVVFIVLYSLSITGMAWDWVMSLDPHWYSTIFMFYGMVSHLVAAVALTAIISIYLKNQGSLPLFNDNHQHDLAKYMFGFSILWTYLWFCQFMLQWYADIPEEVQYFQQRNAQYPGYYWMLLVNFLLVLLIMTSSGIKRVPQLVFWMGVMIILGHYWDFYNQIMPAAVGAFHNFGLLEIGSLMFVGGLFTYVVFTAISKLNLEPKGNPYFHESKIYEYPF